MWARVDDRMPSHPKFARAAAALGGVEPFARVVTIWLEGLCYACAYATDGHLDRASVARFHGAADPLAVADALVAAALWEVTSDGFMIHDFGAYTPSAEQVFVPGGCVQPSTT